jgi:hypothetical protein
MGVKPNEKVKQKRPSLKVVGHMVVAAVRMQRLQKEWAVHKNLQASLVKKAEQVRRGSRRSVGY